MSDREQPLADIEQTLRELQDFVQREARGADRLLRENLWLATGLAAAGGFVVGVLAARRQGSGE